MNICKTERGARSAWTVGLLVLAVFTAQAENFPLLEEIDLWAGGGLLPASSPQETWTVPLPWPSTPRPATYVKSPLLFERNDGQVDGDARFLCRGPGYHLFLSQEEAVLTLFEPGLGGSRWHSRLDDALDRADFKPLSVPHVLRTRFLGANPSPSVTGEQMEKAKANYFIGNNPALWRTNVPTFARVQYHDLYPGIDLVFYGNGGQLEYDFVVAPGADPNRIVLEIEGPDQLEMDPANGDLIIHLGGEKLRWKKPLVYQMVKGVRREVAGEYRSGERPLNSQVPVTPGASRFFVWFQCATYDPQLALVIDPVLIYATYLGGSNWEGTGPSIAVDQRGSLFVTSATTSTDFPVKGALTPVSNGDYEAVVAKFSSAGELLFSTYLGGKGLDHGWALALDLDGTCWIAGSTTSTDFPTVNPIQRSLGGNADNFLLRLKDDGSDILFSTYFGGAGEDYPYGNVRLDRSGNIYLAGLTESTNFPVLHALQPTMGGPLDERGFQGDGFVAKFAEGGKALIYSTYLGGSKFEYVKDLAVDDDGYVYVAGITRSSDFPVKNAAQSSYSGDDSMDYPDLFYAKIVPDGSDFIYSSYFGTNEIELDPSIALDSHGHFVLSAWTSQGGWAEALVAQFDASTGTLISSTLFGGSNNDYPTRVAVDAAGDIYIVGSTSSDDFVLVQPLQDTLKGVADGFLTKLSATDLSVVFSTYFGGAGTIALDVSGNIFIAGTTSSSLPILNAAQNTLGGSYDIFVAKISMSEVLKISRAGSTLIFSWLATAAGLQLEGASTLGGTWALIATPPTIVGDEQIVTLEASGAARFFRLRKL